MNFLFYNQFQLQDLKIVLFCGDDSREMLSSILAKEIASQKQKAIIFSDAPLKYPVEGQILVDIETDLLLQKLKTDPSAIIYLCSAIEEKLLLPISNDLIKNILQIDFPEVRFLIQLKEQTVSNHLKNLVDDRVCLVTALNYQSLEPQLGQFLTDFNSEKKFSDDLTEHWLQMVQAYCPGYFLHEKIRLQKFLFINQVKSLIDENKMMGIFRNLIGLYDHIYFGDINDSKIREI